MATKPKKAHCCVGGCNNDDRYPHKYVVHSNVKTMRFFKFTTSQKKRQIWIKNISSGLENFSPGSGTYVCANHFVDGEPTTENPNPTLFLTMLQNKFSITPKKRKVADREQASMSQTVCDSEEIDNNNAVDLGMEIVADQLEHPKSSQFEELDREPIIVSPSLYFEEVVKESMVTEYTGLPSAKIFTYLFESLHEKAKNMNYWKGQVQVSKEKQSELTSQAWSATFELFEEAGMEAPLCKRGPKRKLTMEQEFLMVLMKIKVGLMNHDLAFGFKISSALVSKTVATWLRFMAKELKWMIMWPSKGQIRLTLPVSFERLYPNVRCIIDCTEVFTDTPSALDVQATLWSEYKHNCTFKFLVGITPNGTPSYVSKCYGGRASDKFIVRDCGFVSLIQRNDQMMADCGFKIKDDLLLRNATLCIPPSTTASIQMCSSEVQKTSRIANIRIYVEQAIGRLKYFRILKNVLPLKHLYLCDDIVTVVCALTCLRGPLCM